MTDLEVPKSPHRKPTKAEATAALRGKCVAQGNSPIQMRADQLADFLDEITRLRAELAAREKELERESLNNFLTECERGRLKWLEWHFEALSRAECRRQRLSPDELISDRGDLAWQLVGYEAAVREMGTEYRVETTSAAPAEGGE